MPSRGIRNHSICELTAFRKTPPEGSSPPQLKSRIENMAKKKPDDGAQFTLYFGPVLDALRALGGSGTPSEVVSRIASDLRVPDDVQNELLPSGESRFRNQVAWARMYLVHEGLVDRSKRGVWSLTEPGRTAFLSREDAREIFRKVGTNTSGEAQSTDCLARGSPGGDC